MVKQLLEEALRECNEATMIADRHAAFLTRRAEIAIPAEADPVTELVSAAKATLTAADRQAEAHNYGAAMDLLEQLSGNCLAIEDYKARNERVSRAAANLPRSSAEANAAQLALTQAAELTR